MRNTRITLGAFIPAFVGWSSVLWGSLISGALCFVWVLLINLARCTEKTVALSMYVVMFMLGRLFAAESMSDHVLVLGLVAAVISAYGSEVRKVLDRSCLRE